MEDIGRLISPKDASKLTSLSVRTLKRMVQAGKFPTSIKIENRVVFVEKEVQAWIFEQVARARSR